MLIAVLGYELFGDTISINGEEQRADILVLLYIATGSVIIDILQSAILKKVGLKRTLIILSNTPVVLFVFVQLFNILHSEVWYSTIRLFVAKYLFLFNDNLIGLALLLIIVFTNSVTQALALKYVQEHSRKEMELLDNKRDFEEEDLKESMENQ